jgi:hypothetical protein
MSQLALIQRERKRSRGNHVAVPLFRRSRKTRVHEIPAVYRVAEIVNVIGMGVQSLQKLHDQYLSNESFGVILGIYPLRTGCTSWHEKLLLR